jgi:hypothetical protein
MNSSKYRDVDLHHSANWFGDWNPNINERMHSPW